MNKQLPSNRNWSCYVDIVCVKTKLLFQKKISGKIPAVAKFSQLQLVRGTN